MKRKYKIFGIGLPKTGQTSLAKAMYLLGFKTKQYPYNDKQIDNNDFAIDLPVAINFKRLDKKYPNSKFILPIRDYDSWIVSMRNHYRRFPASKRYKDQLEFRKQLWGTIYFNKNKMTQKYYAHERDVEQYFKKRKKDILIMDICGGDGWKKLCKFLRRKIPSDTFPHENIGKYPKSAIK